jgi:hypothetical protein
MIDMLTVLPCWDATLKKSAPKPEETLLTWTSSMTHFYIEIKMDEPSNLDMSKGSLDLLGRGRHKKPADEIGSTARTSHITRLRRGVAEDSTGPPAVKPKGLTIKRDQIGDRVFEGIRGLIS